MKRESELLEMHGIKMHIICILINNQVSLMSKHINGSNSGPITRADFNYAFF